MSKLLLVLLLALPVNAQSLQEREFAAASLGDRKMNYRVLLPDGYKTGRQRFPVLYLLHGLSGSHRDWADKSGLARYAKGQPLIIVMPDADDSWYANSASQPHASYEDYIARDLVAEIDGRFRTRRERNARAVAGLSMGGAGALRFAIKYPQVFGFAGSFSGALDVARNPEHYRQGTPNREQTDAVFGPAGSATRREADVFALASAAEPAALPFLYFDCGTDDSFLPENREFATLLQKRKIAYEYREVPGRHDWKFWDKQVREFFAVLANHGFMPAHSLTQRKARRSKGTAGKQTR